MSKQQEKALQKKQTKKSYDKVQLTPTRRPDSSIFMAKRG